MILHGKNIFIVEDNLANRAIAQMLLEGAGANTAIDRWGIDTIERLRNFMPVDLIILDLMFPGGITGYDVFNDIRNLPEFDNIPIVAVSAADAATAAPKTRQHGFAGFIPKPVSYNQFADQIARVIQGEQIWQTR